MTTALKSVFDRASKYPADKQAELAAIFEEDMNAEEAWEQLFEVTTDNQAKAFAAQVKHKIDKGRITSGADFLAAHDL